MIWRDDDILYAHSRLEDLLDVDGLLRSYGQVHTIAVMAETLTPELGWLIRSLGMVAELHGWGHQDLSVDADARDQLPAAVERIADLCGRRPTVLYPPWNRTSPELAEAASRLGLTVSPVKVSLEQYLRFKGDVSEDTVNFHYWHEPDRALLKDALELRR